jgi:hypothetical protein
MISRVAGTPDPSSGAVTEPTESAVIVAVPAAEDAVGTFRAV